MVKRLWQVRRVQLVVAVLLQVDLQPSIKLLIAVAEFMAKVLLDKAPV